MSEQKNTRKRGDELLDSLYDATIRLMAEVRHTNLTFQQVADAAKTSRTVLYRRWPTMFDLLHDIYTHKAKKLLEGGFFEKQEDTGSLRGDLLLLLNIYQAVYTEIGITILNNYYYIATQKESNAPATHSDAAYKHLQAVKNILENAKARGEKVKKISTITMMLPFDLVRV